MSWLAFLTSGEGPGVDSSWASQCVNSLRYKPPPPAVAPADGGRVSGMVERDRLVKDLHQENWDLKLCVAALVELVVSSGLTDREKLAAAVERLALGYTPGEGGPTPGEDNPFADLR